VRVGEAEAEVDGVSWRCGLVGCWVWEKRNTKQGAGGGLGGYIPVCMETKEPQTEMEALSSRPVMR
jgi:hypothetical protein